MVDSYGLHVDKYHIPSIFHGFFFQVDPLATDVSLVASSGHQAGNMSKARSSGSVCSMCSDLFLEEGGGLDLGSTRTSSSVLFCFEKFFSRPKVRETHANYEIRATENLCFDFLVPNICVEFQIFCHGNLRGSINATSPKK